ncbi:MAG: hypothetical protein QCI00_00300 [Candidatus Thermoplasmatota archaeon]|nr:hypothetical protein [Candidatus Thermoplasmatota archaeon]
MISETKQKENRKEKKISSTEMFDSLFDSTNQEKKTGSHKPEENIQDTERLIDEILASKNHSNESVNELDPTVTIVEEKEKETENEHCFPCQQDCSDAGLNKPFDLDEREEIFEVKKPVEKIQDVDDTDMVKDFESSNGTDQTKKSSNKKKDSKISFSFALPKINVKIKKRIKPSIKDKEGLSQKQQKQSISPQSSIQTIDAVDSKISGRIHGLTQINEKDSNDKKPEGSVKKKNKLCFKSKKFFSKKTQKRKSDKQINISNDEDESCKTSTVTPFEVAVDEDIIKLLRITDDLLGKLPDEIIEEFSQSDDFSLYEKVMRKYDVIK